MKSCPNHANVYETRQAHFCTTFRNNVRHVVKRIGFGHLCPAPCCGDGPHSQHPLPRAQSTQETRRRLRTGHWCPEGLQRLLAPLRSRRPVAACLPSAGALCLPRRPRTCACVPDGSTCAIRRRAFRGRQRARYACACGRGARGNSCAGGRRAPPRKSPAIFGPGICYASLRACLSAQTGKRRRGLRCSNDAKEAG